ncbi:MAG: GNAT family protein [Candidatus Nomurabacteria bacterium]|nr:GNAT family protein [Candidatus Nomurabacteria bacterium]
MNITQSTEPGNIVGNKVVLRPIKEEDLQIFMTWVNHPEIFHYLNKTMPITFEEELAWYYRSKQNPKDRIDFTILDKETENPIGTLGVHHMDNINGVAYTGTIISTEYQCCGYATEAKMLLLNYVFSHYNVRVIYSYIKGYNEKSIAYATKCGYKEITRFPKHYFRESDGKYHDRVIMVVEKDEWIRDYWTEYTKRYNL